MEPGGNSGVHAMDWSNRVVKLLGEAKIGDLLEETTADQLSRAGNVAGEILNWIAMLGTFDAGVPLFIEAQGAEGHAFAAWSAATPPPSRTKRTPGKLSASEKQSRASGANPETDEPPTSSRCSLT